jgi:hypothetical protein
MVRRLLLAVAVVAVGLGSIPSVAQELCGGITGTPCNDPGEFCELPDGQCCCDFVGRCSPIPQGCPAIYDPVCGCDGRTYSSRCEASHASASVDYLGPCSGGPEVTGVVFTTRAEMVWDHMTGALAYNVYVKRGPPTSTDPPAFGGHCLRSALPGPRVLLEEDPPIGALWEYQVTAMYDRGEGSLGMTSQGVPRVPAAPCTCTLPVDSGPCDGVCPRWFYDFVAGECEEFLWGCCGGNANNFPNQETCLATCPE